MAHHMPGERAIELLRDLTRHKFMPPYNVAPVSLEQKTANEPLRRTPPCAMLRGRWWRSTTRSAIQSRKPPSRPRPAPSPDADLDSYSCSRLDPEEVRRAENAAYLLVNHESILRTKRVVLAYL